MKELIINDVMNKMSTNLTSTQLKELKKALSDSLSNVQISIEEETTDEQDKIIESFISAKRVEGLSNNTLIYYQNTIIRMLDSIRRPIKLIDTDSLRSYLSDYQNNNNSSHVTIDNIRRILSTFFTWLEDEDYIIKSPIRRIHKIKTLTLVKETYSDESLEKMRDRCTNLRDLALIDILASTGMRVGELVKLNIKDIDFNERECKVLGKGNKERIVYFDARTKVHLQEYLNFRKDTNEALFVSLNSPYNRLKIGGIEARIKHLGDKLQVGRSHPHKFRRTLATKAIDKGMPIEQLQVLLGHRRIDTTLQYAMVNQTNVKNSYRKVVG